MNISSKVLKIDAAQSLLSNPHYVYDTADFKCMEYVEFDLNDHKIPVEVLTKNAVVQTVRLEYSLPVFKELEKELSINFWISFGVIIEKKAECGFSVYLDQEKEKSYLISLSDSSSCIEGMNEEETEKFILNSLVFDEKVPNMVIGQAFMDYAKELSALNI